MNNLWDTKRCAEFLGLSVERFRKIKTRPDLPQPLDMPGRPKWRPEDWERWIKSRAIHAIDQ